MTKRVAGVIGVKNRIFFGARQQCVIAMMALLALLARDAAFASTVTFDGDGTSSITLATPNNWSTNTLPVTTDQAVFTDAAFGGPLPASLTNGSTQTWGNLVWDSNSSTTLSGTRITMSGLGGNANGDLITLGSNMTSGTLNLSFANLATSFISATTGNINIVNAGATLTMSTEFEFNSSVASQVITKTGAGTLNFSNGNNGNGGAGTNSRFVLDQGTVNFSNGNGNMFGGSSTTVFEIHGGTFLDTNAVAFDVVSSKNYAQIWAGDFTYKATTNKALNLGTGAVTMTNGSRQITVLQNTLTVGGVIGDGGNGYGITKAGAGSLTLTGANTFTGGVTVNAGTLNLQGSNSYTADTVVNGGTLVLGFNVATAPTNNIVNSSSVLKLAGGTVTLTGKASTTNSQTFTNGVTLNAGASIFTATSGATGGIMNATLGTVTRNVGSTLRFNLPTSGAIAVSNSNDANGLFGPGIIVGASDWATISGGNVVAFTGYTSTNAVGSWAVNQNITTSAAPSGSLAADLTLNSLRLSAGNNIGTVNLGGKVLTVLDGVLVGAATTQGQTISNGTLRGANGDLVLINNNNSGSAGATQLLTISANIVNNGTATALTIAGSKPIVLSGTNSYTGATYVNTATLRAGSANPAFGNNSAMVISTGATLDLNNFSQTIGSLASNNATGGGTGAVTLGTATLTTGGDNTSTTFNGVISGTGAVVKTGTGTQTLTGVNTYTGATTVSGGILKVNNTSGSGTGTGTVLIQSTATLGGGNGAAFSGATSTLGSATYSTYLSSVVGTISGATTIASGGHLAPGNSVGTLTIATLALSSGSILDYEFNLVSNDLTAVTAAGGLSFGTVGINLYQEGTTTAFSTAGLYNIFDYNTSFTGLLSDLSVLNPTAGFSYTFIDDTANTLIQLQVVAVPEPSTFAMLGMGLGALWFLRRKKKA